MKKAVIILIISILATILFAEIIIENDIEYMDAEGVYPINNRDYTPNVIKLFRNAEKTIHIFMLSGGYYPNYPNGVNRQMYQVLFDAVKRGVEVQIVLDQAGYNPGQSYGNLALGEFLRSGGIDVYYDDPDETVHSKTLIIDSLYTIVGSTNWSYWALDKNNECSVIIKSINVALEYEEYFDYIMSKSFSKITVIK